jgi:hypothetical protein
MKQNDLMTLTNAQANMKRYSDENRFNISKIKPEFSMVTCTPLLNARFLVHGSPLLIPLDNKGLAYQSKTPNAKIKTTNVFPMKSKSIREEVLSNSCNFSEKEMDEKRNACLVKVPPPTPGFTRKELLLDVNYAATSNKKNSKKFNKEIVFAADCECKV